jgi:hypothetical protein
MKSHKDVKTNRCSKLRFFEEVITVFHRGTKNSSARCSLTSLKKRQFRRGTVSRMRHFFRPHKLVEFPLCEISEFQRRSSQAAVIVVRFMRNLGGLVITDLGG